MATAAVALLAAAPAQAEVKESRAAGFRLENRSTIAAAADKIGAALLCSS